MGLYFNPPPVVQAAVHAPIAAQGQQPPPYRPIAAVMVAASLAWTPAPAPAQEPSNVAPLIPVATASPPTPISIALSQAIRATWDSQPSWSTQHAALIAPLTLTYGQQPPSYAGAAQITNILATPPLTWSAQSASPNAGWNFIPPAVNQPPPVSIAGYMAIRSSWPVDAWNAQRAPWLAPLTLTYGQQPPAYSIAAQAAIRATWDSQPTWTAQSDADNAGWNFTATVAANPPPRPNVNLAIIGAAWSAVPWTAQSEFDNAGWNASAALPAQVPAPRSVILASIVSSWSTVGWATQSETDNAGWNFLPPAVQNPPPGGPHPTAAQLASAWSVSWVSQRAAPVAGFVPPPTTVVARITVTPNADRSVKPGADRILIVYAPRTVS
jgi:hypothetical protein